jgi:amino acid adenylation domain-containing protein
MKTLKVLAELRKHQILLALNGDNLVVKGRKEALKDKALLEGLRHNKPKIIKMIKKGLYCEQTGRFDYSTLPTGSHSLDVASLPLVDLSEEEQSLLLHAIPGGAENIEDIYPLSPLQEGLLYHHITAQGGDAYLIHSTFIIEDETQLAQFENALNFAIQRHTILRSSIHWQGLSQAVQVVWREAPVAAENCSTVVAGEDTLAQLTSHFCSSGYRLKLEQAPLIKLHWCRDNREGHIVAMLIFHHIIMDHLALDLLQQEMQAWLRNETEQLPVSLPYRDYVMHSRLGIDEQAQIAFFRERLADVCEPTLPLGLQEVHGDGSLTAEARHSLSPEFSLRLRACARHLGVSPASLHHLAWARLLATLAGREDVTFGTVLLGRMSAATGDGHALGMFINTLPLRLDMHDIAVGDAVALMHSELTALLTHEHASLALAQRCSGIDAPAPLFSALLNYRHSQQRALAEGERYRWNGIEVLDGGERTNYPLVLCVDDLPDRFCLTLQVSPEHNPHDLCAMMDATLHNLVAALEQSPARPLLALRVLPDDLRQCLIDPPVRDAGESTTLVALFERQAAATPDAVALDAPDAMLSYRQLNQAANRLAHRLRQHGIGPEDRVALCASRSTGMLVALLGILKAGAGYVPVDPAWPAARQAFVLADCAPSAIVLTDDLPHLPDADLPLQVSLRDPALLAMPDTNPSPLAGPHSLAYIIYTSGSTGTPKGVIVEHHNVVRLFSATDTRFRFTGGDVWTLFHSFAFDFSVWEIWGALLHGGRLVIVPQTVCQQPAAFYQLLCEKGVTVLNQTPSAFSGLVAAQGAEERAHRLRLVIFGGEALDMPALRPWFRRPLNQGAALVNMYGITETTVHVTLCDITARDAQHKEGSPIGGAIADLALYLLDARGEPVPAGCCGEIYVGGAGVARGYLNREALTAERFLPDPFSPLPGARMYRSGDLARREYNGGLSYLGRNDHQVKIRGFRIETGEIAAALMDCDGVQQAVVAARPDAAGDPRLVAWFTVADTATADIARLRDALSARLPAYMVPSAWVQVPVFPLTVNGKLDMHALPGPDDSARVREEYVPPEGETEQTIADVWQQLLGVNRVGRHDNFFALGGHSLLAVRLSGILQQHGLACDVRDLFGQPSLAALAAHVRPAQSREVPAVGIPAGCEHITPGMLPMLSLTAEEIAHIVATVPGGAANIQDIYPLAPLQEGILYHHLTQHKGDAYLLYSLFGIDSESELESFIATLNQVINRHDVMRTGIVWENISQPVQVVYREAALQVDRLPATQPQENAASQLLETYSPRVHRLALGKAPLLRVTVQYDTQLQRYIALLLFHHILLDHTAMEAIQLEMQQLLSEPDSKPARSIPYREYVYHSRFTADEQAQIAFFRERLADVCEPTLPLGLQEVHGDGSLTAEARHSLSPEFSLRLRACARHLGVSPASLHHLAWARLLATLAGREDVTFGTVLLGRMSAATGDGHALGMFINTLPLRLDMHDIAVGDAVALMHSELTALLTHEHASLALAQRCSGIDAPAPLFSALLNYRHSQQRALAEGERYRWNGIEVLDGGERTNYPLVLCVDDLPDRFCLTLQVSPEHNPHDLCAMMDATLHNLVAALEQSPARPLLALRVLPDDLRQCLIDPPVRDAGESTTLVALFERQAAATPDAVALDAPDAMLSYRQLNQAANRLAHRLRQHGIGPEDRVALCASRSTGMLVALLGILKAGAGYVPVDPAWPAARQAFVLADCAPSAIVLTDDLPHLPDADLPLQVSLRDPALLAMPDTNPSPLAGPHSLAYIIYTSGSTGTPKGVIVEHHNVVRLFSATDTRFRFTGGDVWTLFHSFAFDFSVWEIWGALLHGGRLVIVPQTVCQQPAAFYQLLCEKGVTVLNQTPSAFSGLVAAQGAEERAHRLRLVIFGGEALDMPALRPWFRRPLNQGAALVNMYGITETTVHVTLCDITARDAQHKEGSPIGGAIADLALYLLDARGEPVPAGCCGEIYVGGAGVARGYLNREALTAERFLPDPFSPLPGARMYRSGDLARREYNGGLSYLGRNDHQVKIRGFRIETGEIAAALMDCDGVQQAVVAARPDAAGDPRLVAWFTVADTATADIARLRDALSARLPAYMVPSAWVQVPVFPLTVNGKLDMHALPGPDDSARVREEYVPPEGETEQTIADVWQQLLGVNRVGRHDNFFALGGHSLLAVRLSGILQQHGLACDVRDLFGQPSLAALAAHVRPAQSREVPAVGIPAGCEHITPGMLPMLSLTAEEIAHIVATVPGGAANIQDIYPLAPLQEGILYHHLMQHKGDPYMLQAVMAFSDQAAKTRFTEALQLIINRHDILRTAFVWEGIANPVQVVCRRAELYQQELTNDRGNEDPLSLLQQRFNAENYRLPLSEPPLIRLYWIEDPANQRWLACIVFHHLIDDATSLGLMKQEFDAIFRGEENALPVSVPYREYIYHSRFASDEKAQQAFFSARLADVDTPTLPFDSTGSSSTANITSECRLQLDDTLSHRLRDEALRLGVSPASLYHLAWARVISALSGRDEAIFGTVLLGRMSTSSAEGHALGIFINTLPIRIAMTSQPLDESVRQVHKELSALLAHEQTSLALAQRCSGINAPAPLFSALLNYRHIQAQAEMDDRLWQGISFVDSQERTNYPLMLSVDDLGEHFRLNLQAGYGQDAARLVNYVVETLKNLLSGLARDLTPADLSLLPETETIRLLEQAEGATTPVCAGSVTELFQTQAAATPSQTAINHYGEKLSYRELDERSTRLAQHLIEQGVVPGNSVALCLTRGVEMVTALLAVLKAGAAYIPLDVSAPPARLRDMLDDARPALMLVHDNSGFGQHGDTRCFALAEIDRQRQPPQRPLPEVTPEQLAYIIYTSGSTGKPKGVAMPHGPLVNLLQWQRKQTGDAAQRTLQFSASGFDVAFQEIFSTLCTGGELFMINESLRLEFPALYRFICDNKIERMFMPFIALQRFAEAVISSPEIQSHSSALHDVITAGEQLQLTESIRTLFTRLPAARLHNHYGPTETHVCSGFILEGEARNWPELPPIGKAVDNCQIYILDAKQRLVPSGVVGELYVAGACLAQGYIHQPELTRERFISASLAEGISLRLYRTGDLARYGQDGNIDYLGRNDQQIKLRGYRIEPAEIELCLNQHPAVSEAAVTVHADDDGEKHLIAYYAQRADSSEITPACLQGFMQERLPAYMIPSVLIPLENMPLSPNGKVFRKGLPEPRLSDVPRSFKEAPQGETEQQVAALWRSVLKRENIGRHDDFFMLGGHSLMAVRIISLLSREGHRLSVADLYRHSTVATLSECISQIKPAAKAENGIVSIRSEGSQAPLFLLHEISGLDTYFYPLAKLIDADIPVYGLVPPPLKDSRADELSLSEMATRMVRHIRAVQPQGPYHLAGWSFGGLLAWETAAQLADEGQAIAFLGMFDSWLLQSRMQHNRSNFLSMKTQLMALVHHSYVQLSEAQQNRISALLNEDDERDEDALFTELEKSGVLAVLAEIQSDLGTRDGLQNFIKRMMQHGQAGEKFEARPLPLMPHLFVAGEGSGVEEERGITALDVWQHSYEGLGLKAVMVPGTHQSIMDDNLPALAKELNLTLKALRNVQRKPAEPTEYSALIPLQQGETAESVLLCIPGAGDNVTAFIPLVESLNSQLATYGLQPRGLDIHQVPHTSVGEMVEDYLAAIAQEFNPAQKFHLVGHSFGGKVAFELACQLQQQGRDISSLTLLDTSSPGAEHASPHPLTPVEVVDRWLKLITQRTGKRIELPAPPALDTLLETLKDKRVFPPHFGAEPLFALLRSFNYALQDNFRPTLKFKGTLHFLSASREEDQARGRQAASWAPWTEAVRERISTGNHITMLSRPHVQLAADIILQATESKEGHK